MNNERRLAAFFNLENARKWAEYRAFLHPQVQWVLFFREGRECFNGADAYMERIRAAYRDGGGVFRCKKMLASGDGNRIAAVLENAGGEISLDIFDFKDGLIFREYEYLL